MAGDDLGPLMAAAQAGDAASYRRLLVAIEAWLRRFYASRLPPRYVDDAVQDAMLAIHEKRHTYSPDRPFHPWLAAIARYKWIDRLRHMRTSATEPLLEDVPTGDHGDAVATALSLQTLMRVLKPAQADVIRLVKLEGFSIEEAASRTGQSPSLVKVNIHRGLGKLIAAVRRRPDVA